MIWPVGYTEDTTSNTEWTSVSSQDLVGAGSYFLLQLQIILVRRTGSRIQLSFAVGESRARSRL